MPLWGPGALVLSVRFLCVVLQIAVGLRSAAVACVGLHLGSDGEAIELRHVCCFCWYGGRAVSDFCGVLHNAARGLGDARAPGLG
jgi:hypothetical protein